MYTYIVKTRAPRGPRSYTSETFVVIAKSVEHARCQAIAAAHPGAQVTSAELVAGVVKRVHVG